MEYIQQAYTCIGVSMLFRGVRFLQVLGIFAILGAASNLILGAASSLEVRGWGGGGGLDCDHKFPRLWVV